MGVKVKFSLIFDILIPVGSKVYDSITFLLGNVKANSISFEKAHFNAPPLHSHTMYLDIIKVFYLPTDAQENCFEKNIKIYIKTAPTCFSAVTPSSGSALFELAKVIVIKNIN